MSAPSIMGSAVTGAQRLLKVAIVGLPNAGKSTLINNMLSLTVCPVSKRVHTTRLNQNAVYLENDTQIVFVDTPGLVNMKEIKKFAFPKDFVLGPEQSVRAADIVAVIHDLSCSISRNKLDPRIKALLEKFPEKSPILILNKVDRVKSKGTLLDTVRILTSGVVGGRPIALKKSHDARLREEKIRLEMNALLNRAKKKMELNERGKVQGFLGVGEEDDETMDMMKSAFSPEEIGEKMHLVGWPRFNDVFMISALKGSGINLLKEYFITNAKASAWQYGEDFLTDVDPKELAIRMLKSLMLNHLPQEIPYKLNPKLEYWEKNDSGVLRIIVKLECPNDRYVGRVTGTGGTVMKLLTEEAETLLTELLRAPISLAINPVSLKKT